MNMHTYQPPMTEKHLRKLYEIDLLTQREIAVREGVSLKRIQTAMRRYGIKPRRQVKRNQWGAMNASWKGQRAGYQAKHLRQQARFGRPRKCEHCGTTNAKQYDWASVSGRYDEPSDYKRLCRSCHWKLDRVIRNITGR